MVYGVLFLFILFMVVYNCLLWFMVVCGGLRSCMLAYGGLWWFIIVYVVIHYGL